MDDDPTRYLWDKNLSLADGQIDAYAARIAELEAEVEKLETELCDALDLLNTKYQEDEQTVLDHYHKANAVPVTELLRQLSASQMRCNELEAQLAAVPKWMRVTENSYTWPPDGVEIVAYCFDELGHFTFTGTKDIELQVGDYWLPITPPTEADNE